jgi:hypothetical protein
MSWEVSSVKDYSCPCGSGTYRITTLSDDWGRMEARWEMFCPDCATAFSLYKYYYQDSGKEWPAYVWVKADMLESFQKKRAEFESFKDRIISIARAHYFDTWMHRFLGATTRKEMWALLTDGGSRYPSLSTFYQHTRGIDPQRYIASHFTFDNLPWILGQLAFVDPRVNDLLIEAGQMKQSIEDQERELRQDGFR